MSDLIKDFRRRRIAYVPSDACVGVRYMCKYAYLPVYICVCVCVRAIPLAARSKAWFRPLACWDYGSESRLSLVSVECCLLSDVSATG